MNATKENFLEHWMVLTVQEDENAFVRLNGDNSLYQAYKDACEKEETTPLHLRFFSRRLEFLLAAHFKIIESKGRDRKGIIFRGIRLVDHIESHSKTGDIVRQNSVLLNH